ncbi:hypothetical protein OAN95_06230 [Alphaproteobacteria bacterium]|nr:hypothetical protein [Alphaproteobacteria bacterium]
MRKNTLAYSCLMMALAVPMPSIAALSYIKSTWPDDVRQIHNKINADYKLNNAMENSKSGS